MAINNAGASVTNKSPSVSTGVQPDSLYTVDEAAKACGVCGATIRRWIAAGHVKCVFFGPTKRLRIARDELQRAIGINV